MSAHKTSVESEMAMNQVESTLDANVEGEGFEVMTDYMDGQVGESKCPFAGFSSFMNQQEVQNEKK